MVAIIKFPNKRNYPAILTMPHHLAVKRIMDTFADLMAHSVNDGLTAFDLSEEKNAPEGVDMFDVLYYLVDAVVAARGDFGFEKDVTISPELLHRAFVNTVQDLQSDMVGDDI